MKSTDWLAAESPILFRCFLYFVIASLPVFLDGIKCVAEGTCPAPSMWKVIYLVGSALIPGFTAVRAFYDGSAQRHQDKKEQNDQNTYTPVS